MVEHSYLMRDLTARVIDMALAQAAQWWQDGACVPVSLNVAARDLLDTGLAETISRGLAKTGLPPDAILLEIDERVLTSEPAHAATAAEGLAALGIALSLDDFGTGYSSLVRLRQLPVSEVKIDSSFIGRMLASADDEVIVRSIVDLVHALGIRSVAEGVESAEVAAALQVMGCDAAQGWYFSRPLSAASATAWLAGRGVPGPRGRAAVPGSAPAAGGGAPAADGRVPAGDGRVPAGDGRVPAGDGRVPAADGPAPDDADWTISIPRPASVPASSGPAPRPAPGARRPDDAPAPSASAPGTGSTRNAAEADDRANVAAPGPYAPR